MRTDPTRTVSHGASLRKVARESTASLIAAQLRDAIMDGTLGPGSQLGETELASQLGVSRGPLREAMQRLVQEGLLRSERNRGLFVITLTAEDVRDIYTARAAVERAAVSLIVDGDHVAAAQRLAMVHRDMIKAANRGNRAALSDADLRFHETVVGLSGSPRLARMHATLIVETRICLTALETTPDPVAAAVNEHGELLEAIRRGDRRLLLRLIDAHMDDAVRRLTAIPATVDA